MRVLGLWLWAVVGAWAEPADDEEPELSPAVEFDFSGVEINGSLVQPSMAPTMRSRYGATPGGAQDIEFFRDEVKRSGVPLPEVFTPEGLFSQHDLPLADTEPCQRLMCTSTKAIAAVLPAQDDVRWLAQVGFSSGLSPESFRRPPLDLVAVVDVSCSMSDRPIGLVQDSLRHIIDHHLTKADQLSIVVYGASVHTHLPPTRGDHKGTLQQAVDAITIAGSTNMEAGLIQGFDVARSNRRTFDGTSRVMLFTDERPNTGRTDARTFLGLATGASKDGIGMTTVGVGVQFGADLAQQVASVRGGNLIFVPDAPAAKERFADDFDMLVTELAHDLRIRIAPRAGLRLAGLYGVPGSLVQWGDDGSLSLEIATVFLSNERGGIYVALASDEALPAQVAAGEPVADISLSYAPRDGVRQERTTPVLIATPGPGDEGLTRGLALVDEATTLKQATTLYHHDGDADGAWQLVRALSGRLDAVSDGTLEPERALVKQLEGTLAELSGRTGELQPLQSRRDDLTGLPIR